MLVWTVLFLLIQLLYSLFTGSLWRAWRRIPAGSDPLSPALLPYLSVVVVVRDEAATLPLLLGDLNAQHYPANRFELLIMDDHSTDGTAAAVANWQSRARFPVRLYHLHDLLREPLPEGNYKKKGIEWAVQLAQGECVVLTDGDCRTGPDWLRTVGSLFTRTNAQLISGPVTFDDEQSVFERMQTVEFASLIGSGAATLQMGVPTMGNAANLAFRKAAFQRVDGYANTAQTATGDDLFLMHKLHQHFPGRLHFNKHAGGIVRTKAKPTWAEFYQQRKRWASKWKLYQDWRVPALAAGVFLANAALLLGLVTGVAGWLPWPVFLFGAGVRFGAEYLFLADVLRFLQKKNRLIWILPVQLVYFVYVVFFGVIAQKPGYVWKGRKLNG